MRLFWYFIKFWEDLNLELYLLWNKFFEIPAFLGNGFIINVIYFLILYYIFKPVISGRDVTQIKELEVAKHT